MAFHPGRSLALFLSRLADDVLGRFVDTMKIGDVSINRLEEGFTSGLAGGCQKIFAQVDE